MTSQNSKSILRRLINDESGATMVEYGLMLGLIAVVALAAVVLVGTNAEALFTSNGSAVANSLGN